MSKCIWSKGGSKKYVLEAVYEDYIPFYPSTNVFSHYCELHPNGYIVIDEGFEWDGASGPTIDTDDTMDGSLVHDVLYRMMREGRLSKEQRKEADHCIKVMCIEDAFDAIDKSDISNWRKAIRKAGVQVRFNYWYFFLRVAGGGAAT